MGPVTGAQEGYCVPGWLGHSCLFIANKNSYLEANYISSCIITLCKQQGHNTVSLIFLLFSVSFNKSITADAVKNFNKTVFLTVFIHFFLSL